MSDKDYFAFVAEHGSLIGVAQTNGDEDLRKGLALAMLAFPVDLFSWVDALNKHKDIHVAADAMVRDHGGVRIQEIVTLDETVVMPRSDSRVIGEA